MVAWMDQSRSLPQRRSRRIDCRNRLPKLVFDFSEGRDRARCITVTHSYKLDWRRIAAKLTGTDAAPSRSRTRKVMPSAVVRTEPSCTLPVSW